MAVALDILREQLSDLLKFPGISTLFDGLISEISKSKVRAIVLAVSYIESGSDPTI